MGLTVETYASAAEAARALAAAQDARYLGGGTLVMRAVNYGDQSFRRILRATDPALGRIAAQGGRISVGAGVTMAEITESRELGFLAPAARAVGGPAIRSMATVGGNLFAAHPYGDLAAALLALDGRAVLADGREQALDELFAARGRGQQPLVTAVTIARPERGAFRFRKVSRVKPKGVSVMSIAAWLPRSGGRIAGARVAYGAMGPTPRRVPRVEQALEGRTLDAAGVQAAVAAAAEGLDPPEDAIASAWYRRAVAPVHLRRLLLEEDG
ncbi:FAD binding domain-containing protein [Paralimibaculum aggregatum]|uniref:FAD binding domain-containing protein n=1 Tax=Paralimibaculum aggregatum TaxID=3036245 RepID=A0ABQ6LHM6_9RHOB|nr:FAD binding domain-containing protein [Limibaculum sp. NKW23]GMG82785.1 FAD binding domain-containing protein [Limibaculum sp. NKW23]